MNLAINMATELESIGKRLSRIREEKGYTQKDVAEAVGVSQQTIGNIEKKGSGSTKMPEIAEFLEVSINHLLKGEHPAGKNLSLVNTSSSSGYSVEDIRAKFPLGFDKAVNTVRNMLFQQGKLIDGDVNLISNKDLISSVLLKCILIELTNDLFINDNINTLAGTTEQEKATKL
jgi:transcriptional regulator with XRE-family HTH domain